MKQRIFSLDAVRALAILGVVAIHSWYPVYSRPDFAGGFSWWLAYTINAFSRVAVPWFLMVSGTLLLPRKPKQEMKDTLGRLVWRLGVPLIFWSIVYFWWEYRYYGRLIYPYQALYAFFTGTIFHLYFLVILFGLYLWLPLWRAVRLNRYVLGVSFSVGVVIYALQFFLYKERSILNFFTLWVPYLGYFLSGPYLFNLKAEKQKKIKAMVIFLGAGLITIIGGYFNLKYHLIGWGLGGSEYLTNWLAPNVILLALSGFYLVVRTSWPENKWFKKTIQGLAGCSLGIYLIHMIIINILDKYAGFYLDFQGEKLWLWGVKKTVAVLGVAWILTAIMIRIPGIRNLIGEKS